MHTEQVYTPVRLVTGCGSVRQLGSLIKEEGVRQALIATDSGIVKAGHEDTVLSTLRESGIAASVFDQVRENPDEDVVVACVDAALACRADGFVGLGGGSSLDTAKACNFVVTNGGQIKAYWGREKASKSMLPFIAVPTTAGTGSECQRFALISDSSTHQKMACGDRKALARAAILDPELTLTQPPFVTSCTGMDALAHAVESAVTRDATAESLACSCEAFRRIQSNFSIVMTNPDDLRAREHMQVGAAFSGAAIELSMLGAAHAAANPLTAHFGVTHGQAVAIMLPEVIQLNREDERAADGYKCLAVAAGLIEDGASAGRASSVLLQRIIGLLDDSGLRRPLHEFGIEERDLGLLSSEAETQWVAQFNPIPMTPLQFEACYRKVLR